MRKLSSKKIAVLIIVGIIILSFLLAYSRYQSGVNTPLNKESTEKISLIIKKGVSVTEIGETLIEKGVIKSEFSFYWYARLNDLDKDIVSGRFILSPSMTVPEILAKISDPKESEAVITIQEGLKIRDIDKKLAELEITTEGDFITAVKNFDDYERYPFLDKKLLKETLKLDLPLEGYLYPDTYFLDPTEFTADDLIYKALNNFKNKIGEHPEILTQTKIKMHDLVTMASILEREVRSSTDRKTVAGILWKRLESGWKLDADATLLYTKADNKITSADLASDNPYNTRRVAGLPPGPICNPSIDSILSALNPTTSNYWFYLTAKDGTTKYATSNDEHNANKAKYL